MRKLKKLAAIAMTAVLAVGMVSLVGCTSKGTDKSDTQTEQKQDTNNSEETNGETKEEAKKGQIKGLMSEEDDDNVKFAINEYMKFDDEAKKATRYYYNTVDLNGDGANEIIAVLVGTETSGTGGSTALILEQGEASWLVKQKLTLVNPPIIVSENKTNDYRDLIVYRSGGGADEAYVALTYEDGEYVSVNDAKAVEDMSKISGISIINNDLSTDVAEGKAMYLN